jgi:hypothetical protein
MQENDATTLTLVQPSARRREWKLCRGAETRASLHIPTFRRGATAETPERRLRIARLRGVRGRYAVVDETSGAEIAQLRPEGRRRLLEVDGVTAEWKSLGRRRGFGFVGEDEEPLVAAKVRSGLFTSSGEVEIKAGLQEQTALVAAILACYMLIRRAEEASGAAAGATAAVVTS